jgi:2-dehydro-3-deoxy-D-gluconate 5-dehydrogenase
MEVHFDLGGKVAVVTGGCGGIGFTLAKALAEAGAETVIVDIKKLQGKQVAHSIKNEGGKVSFVQVDVSKKSSVDKMVKKVLDTFGKIDILINCAGVIIRKPTLETTERDWDWTIDINMKGLFMCCQGFGRQMIKQGRGKIINISSLAATFVINDRVAYCGSKAGVSQITISLALEWGKHGVYVNAIAPGVIQSPLNQAYINTHPRIEGVIEKIPLGRLGNPDDLVGTALFLASSASDYLTGQTIYVDGGYTLGCMVW